MSGDKSKSRTILVVEDVEKISLLKEYDLERVTDCVTLPRPFFFQNRGVALRAFPTAVSSNHDPHSALLRVITVLNLS
jgi:hypothetical protein